MQTIAKPETQVIDPVCGMTIDPETAAGKRIRDGQSYDFCSPGCQTQFDTGATTPQAHIAEQDAHTHAEVERWTRKKLLIALFKDTAGN
jgi:Cu+-exporting ATPase